MNDKDRYRLLMKESKSDLAKTLVSLGKDMKKLNKDLDDVLHAKGEQK